MNSQNLYRNSFTLMIAVTLIMSGASCLQGQTGSVESLENMLHQQETAIGQLKAQVAEMQKSRTNIDGSLRLEREREVAEMNLKLHNQYLAIQDAYRMKLEKLTSQIDAVWAKMGSASESMENELASELNAIQLAWDQVSGKLKIAHDDHVRQFSEYATEVKTRAGAARNQAQSQIVEIGEQVEKDWETARESLSKFHTGYVAFLKADVLRLEDRVKTSSANVKHAIGTRLASMRKRLAAAEEQFQVNQRQLVETLGAEIADLQNQLKAAEANTKQRIQDEINVLETKRHSAYESLKASYTSTADAVQSELIYLQTMAADAAGELKAELETQQKRLVEKLAATESYLRNLNKQADTNTMKILMVLTSHDQLGNTGKKTGFWLEEFAAPYYLFKDAGATITLASPKGGQPPLDPKSDAPDSQTAATERFRNDKDSQAALASTLKLSSIKASDYDAVFYPGGHGPLWDLAEDRSSIALIEAMFAARKTVAAVCHGPAVFRHTKSKDGTPLVSGKSVTGFANTEEAAVGLTQIVPFLLEDDLKQKGGKYSKGTDFQPYVVTDGNLITGQNPPSSEAAAKAVLQQLKARSN